MSNASLHLAIDLGAESGRGMLGRLDGEGLKLEEVHRFANQPVRLLDTLHWDFPRLFQEVKRALSLAAARAGGRLDSLAVDSWGVDYGLLGPRGELLANPVHYRDGRTEGAMEEVFRKLPREALFDATGIQFLKLNTIFQLHAQARDDPQALARARRLLLIADLVAHYLTGRAAAELTIASTTGLLDVRRRAWSRPVLEALGFPAEIFPGIVSPGTVLGPLRRDIALECGLREPPLVVAAASHDTANAVAAVPAVGTSGWGYVSSGTWSLVGVELRAPQVTREAREGKFTNEFGVEGTVRFLRNIMGLWLVQECRRQWAREGMDLDYDTLTELAERAPPLRSLVDPDDPAFFAPGDMPARIREACARTAQPVPRSEGEVVRCALESLALAYRASFRRIESITGVPIEKLHVVGGGSQNRLLNRFAASALGRPVVAGPVEATASGNVLVQALALGRVSGLDALRKSVRASFATEFFKPADCARWDQAFERFRSIEGGRT